MYMKSTFSKGFPSSNKNQCSWESNLEMGIGSHINVKKPCSMKINARWFEFLFSFVFQVAYLCESTTLLSSHSYYVLVPHNLIASQILFAREFLICISSRSRWC